ncbi:MAG: DinB family protein [Flavipsychrobacter sp.]
MITQIINQYDFNLAFAQRLVEDLTESQMTQVASKGLVNHPAFTLGHLISGSALLVEDLGGTFIMEKEWAELFLRKGPGDPRLPLTGVKYPNKKQLLSELEHQHDLVKLQLRNITNEELFKPLKWRFSNYMPTIADVVFFMCISHESMHLGQLSAWRRAMELPSALAKL